MYEVVSKASRKHKSTISLRFSKIYSVNKIKKAFVLAKAFFTKDVFTTSFYHQRFHQDRLYLQDLDH